MDRPTSRPVPVTMPHVMCEEEGTRAGGLGFIRGTGRDGWGWNRSRSSFPVPRSGVVPVRAVARWFFC